MLELLVIAATSVLLQSLIFFVYRFLTGEWASTYLIIHLIGVNIVTLIIGYYSGLDVISLTPPPMAEIQTIFTIHGGVLMLSMFAFLFTSEIRK